MKKFSLFLCACALAFTAWGQSDNANVSDKYAGMSLNDIRFDGWTDEDWLDNDYIRALRQYLDDFAAGKVEYPELEPFAKELAGKFVVGAVEPALLGGLTIAIIPFENPDHIFHTWVYSSVVYDEDQESDYEVRYINLSDETTGLTKEDVLEIMKEHPKLHFW